MGAGDALYRYERLFNSQRLRSTGCSRRTTRSPALPLWCGCYRIMDPAISPATWPNGSMIRASSMSEAHLTIPRLRPRARSSTSTRPSRTASCWITLILPGDLEAQLAAFVEHYNHQRYHESLNNLTPADLYLSMARPSCWEGKGSNERQTSADACNTAMPLPKITNRASQCLR